MNPKISARRIRLQTLIALAPPLFLAPPGCQSHTQIVVPPTAILMLSEPITVHNPYVELPDKTGWYKVTGDVDRPASTLVAPYPPQLPAAKVVDAPRSE
jgi:hypothetical protein